MHFEESEQRILRCQEELAGSLRAFNELESRLAELVGIARCQVNEGRIADANCTLDHLQDLSKAVAESGLNGRQHQLMLIQGILTLLQLIQTLTTRQGLGRSDTQAGIDTCVLEIIRYLDPDQKPN